MFELMIRLSALTLPVFVFATMANVGMTQDPLRIIRHGRDWRFYLKMLAANFVAAPALMWLLVRVWPLRPEYMAALFVFSTCAGSPFLIRLAATAEHDLALAAATMMILVLGTIVVVPLALPALLTRLTVDGGILAWTLIKQLLLPMLLGAMLAHWAPRLNGRLHPCVARIGNVALYTVILSTIIGYLPQMPPIIRSGALALGLLFVLAAFGFGYLAGWGNNTKEDIGGLATGQRNTAAAMLIAVTGFSAYPSVFVLITLLNTIGIATLIGIARLLRRNNP